MSATCHDAGCLCIPTEPITILGIGTEVIDPNAGPEEVLYFAREDEVWASMPELAVIRKHVAVNPGGTVDWYGTTLDEADVEVLIHVMRKHATGEQVQPLWPLVLCACGVDSITQIEGEPFCHDCAEGYERREQEASL